MNAPRVRLAIGTLTPDTLRAIDAAIRLARALGEPLDCLFVEEADLFHAAALPITRELGMVAPSPRRLDAQVLAGALRRQAERARQEIAEAARRSQVAVSFEVARGRLLREPFERAGADDVVVIGVGGWGTESARTPGEERLLAVVETLPEALEMLRAALGVLPAARPELWPRTQHAERRLGDMLQALQAELGRPLRRASSSAKEGRPTVAEVLAERRPRTLVIDRESMVAAPPELVRALSRLGITVLAAPRRDRRN